MSDNAHYLRLFPLQMVLFPGIRVPLHIFEERYKLMINECVDKQEPFGIILSSDSGAPVPVEVEIGTSALVTEVEKLEEGRMNIVVEGGRRFRVRSYQTDRPYLGAEVDFLDPDITPDIRQSGLVDELSVIFSDYVEKLVLLSGNKLQELYLPDDVELLSSVVASVLAVNMNERQEMLEELDMERLLARQLDIIQKQLPLLKEKPGKKRRARRFVTDEDPPFSTN